MYVLNRYCQSYTNTGTLSIKMQSEKIFSFDDAFEYFIDETKAVQDMPQKPAAGRIILFKETENSIGDWRGNGYRWRATRAIWGKDGLLKRKIAFCITTDSGNTGTDQSWSHRDKPFVLVQFVGDHTIASL